MEGMKFLWEFVKHPLSVGALWPSSPALATAMAETVDWPQARVVAEYGPGTGAFTGRLVSRARTDTKLFAVELNPNLADLLRRRHPNLSVHCRSISDVAAICQTENVDQIDAIVCGLPWASFSAELQDRLLAATVSVLRDGGSFATFAYVQGSFLPSGRRFRKRLAASFSTVQRLPVVWSNLPPAFVYFCRK